MNTLFAAVRAIHYASAMLLFGELAFALVVVGSATRGAAPDGDDLHRRLVLIARWSVITGIASGLAWFAIGAAVMNGTSIGQAMHRSVLELVLSDTRFGHAWVLRFALLAALCVMLRVLRKSAGRAARSGMTIGMLATAALYLGALAWTGHAAAGQGRDGNVEIASDVVHLLASGAWLGALPALVHMLGRTQARGVAARVTSRFSMLGAIAVALLIASGLANAWYLVGDVPALIGTDYGRLLLAKLALFAAMLLLAMTNRWYLSIRLPSEDGEAQRLLRRNAILEIAAGMGVVTIVGALGVTVPAAHEVPVWPFEHTLSWQAGCELGMAAGRSGGGRRHRHRVGRCRDRELSPRLAHQWVVGSPVSRRPLRF
jgi:putative copper resistance protein D